MSRTMENFFAFLRYIPVCTYIHAVVLVRLTKIHHGIVLTHKMFLWFGQLEGCMVMLAISSVLFFTDGVVVHTQSPKDSAQDSPKDCLVGKITGSIALYVKRYVRFRLFDLEDDDALDKFMFVSHIFPPELQIQR